MKLELEPVIGMEMETEAEMELKMDDSKLRIRDSCYPQQYLLQIANDSLQLVTTMKAEKQNAGISSLHVLAYLASRHRRIQHYHRRP